MSNSKVQNFFDGHAKEYKGKYSKANKFYEYFFYERLDRATEKIEFSGKKILDIGAGTGPLYDYLKEKGLDSFSEYHATDISKGMLDQSNIPKKDQYVGSFTEIQLSNKYDLVFMLGVSTYLEYSLMQQHFGKALDVMNDSGFFVVTFTNKHGFDTLVRRALSPFKNLLAGKNRVMSQDFNTYFYSLSMIKKMIPKGMKIVRVCGLNHTVFPFSRLLPSLAIFLANRLFSKTNGRLNRFFSSDLLVFITKE